MRTIRDVVVLLAVAATLAGCAADVRLRHPQTGSVTTCKGGYYTYGLIGMANQMAADLQRQCVQDFQRQGYDRLPE